MVFNGINNDGFMGYNGIKWEDVNFITSGKLTQLLKTATEIVNLPIEMVIFLQLCEITKG